MIKKLFFVFFIFSILSFAKSVRETGYGLDEEDAKKEALSFLTQSIAVDVKSNFLKTIKEKDDNVDIEKENIVNVKSDLPLLGVIFNSFYVNNEYMIDAELNERSISLYESEISRNKQEINSLITIISSNPEKDKKIRSLELLLNKIEEYNKYYLVLSFLKDDNTEFIFYDRTEYELELRKLKKIYDSIDLAVEDNFKEININNIYIYPLTEENSSEITEFSSVLKGKIENLILPASSLNSAEFLMRGNYKVLNDNLAINYKIYNLSGNIIKSFYILLEPNAYKDYNFTSKTYDFDKLIKSGVVISSDFKIDINSSKGKTDLLFTEGEAFNVVIKVNNPCYFYIIGHTLKDDEKYSYLIDFSEAIGNRKFVTYIGDDEVNKWIDLGEFEAIEPFGVESLQVFASMDDIVDAVPQSYFDYETSLYKLGNSPSKNLENARAIIRKRKKTKKIAENFLIFTTMKISN